MSILERFNYQLRQKNLTISDICEKTNLSINDIYDCLTSEKVNIDTLSQISKILHCSFEYLATGEINEFGDKYQLKKHPGQSLRTGIVYLSSKDFDLVLPEPNIFEIQNQIGEIKEFFNKYEEKNGVRLSLTITTSQDFLYAVQLDNSKK